MAFLQDLVNSDEGLEGLDLIGHDGLDLDAGPKGQGGSVIPCVNDASADMLALGGDFVGTRCFFDGDGKLLVGLGVLGGAKGRHDWR